MRRKKYSAGSGNRPPHEGNPTSRRSLRLQLADAKRAVLERGWLTEQDAPFQRAILERATVESFPAGASVFHPGDYGSGIYGVVRGSFGVFVPSRGGEERLAHILQGGSWFGYGPIITRRQRILGFAAVEPSVALHVPLGALDKLATSDPGNLRALLTLREYGMDIAIATVADLLIPAVDKRIAATLLRCAAFSAAEPGRPLVVSGLTQAQIGELANAARDVVNRTLKRLEAKGWIEVSYRKITLLDPPALDSFCSSVGKLQQAPTAERCPPY